MRGLTDSRSATYVGAIVGAVAAVSMFGDLANACAMTFAASHLAFEA